MNKMSLSVYDKSNDELTGYNYKNFKSLSSRYYDVSYILEQWLWTDEHE